MNPVSTARREPLPDLSQRTQTIAPGHPVSAQLEILGPELTTGAHVLQVDAAEPLAALERDQLNDPLHVTTTSHEMDLHENNVGPAGRAGAALTRSGLRRLRVCDTQIQAMMGPPNNGSCPGTSSTFSFCH